MTDTFLVLTPGPCTTVQDRGRFGYQHMGMPVSGALDSFALRTANLMVGNPEACAVLEMTVVGPQLAVMKKADVALTGAGMEMKLNFKPVPPWQSIRVEAGDTLSIQAATSGCRGYLAVTGGIEVPVVMGSRSTYIDGKVGGYKGRPIKKGDIIQSGRGSRLKAARRLPASQVPDYTGDTRLRVIPGPQDDVFDEGLTTFFQSEYTVTADSDRMGCRLQGPAIVHKAGVQTSIISEPVLPGSIQIPADHQPIILFAEQTVGGYAKIATVISGDMPRIAQAVPGDRVKFHRVNLDEAHRIYKEEEKKLEDIAEYLNKP